MTDAYRIERIERLLKELQYEVTRGMMDGEIDEEISFRFVIPVSKAIHNGVVQCEFSTKPVSTHSAYWREAGLPPKLEIVNNKPINST